MDSHEPQQTTLSDLTITQLQQLITTVQSFCPSSLLSYLPKQWAIDQKIVQKMGIFVQSFQELKNFSLSVLSELCRKGKQLEEMKKQFQIVIGKVQEQNIYISEINQTVQNLRKDNLELNEQIKKIQTQKNSQEDIYQFVIDTKQKQKQKLENYIQQLTQKISQNQNRFQTKIDTVRKYLRQQIQYLYVSVQMLQKQSIKRQQQYKQAIQQAMKMKSDTSKVTLGTETSIIMQNFVDETMQYIEQNKSIHSICEPSTLKLDLKLNQLQENMKKCKDNNQIWQINQSRVTEYTERSQVENYNYNQLLSSSKPICNCKCRCSLKILQSPNKSATEMKTAPLTQRLNFQDQFQQCKPQQILTYRKVRKSQEHQVSWDRRKYLQNILNRNISYKMFTD